eukprot:822439-Rhodomonas_salina.2
MPRRSAYIGVIYGGYADNDAIYGSNAALYGGISVIYGGDADVSGAFCAGKEASGAGEGPEVCRERLQVYHLVPLRP